MSAKTIDAADRTKFVGGSDISAILGISPWRTSVDLWLDKIRPRVDGGGNQAAKRRGQRLEPYIVDMIREEHGLEIVARGERYIDAFVPYFAAEIDAEYTEVANIGTPYPLRENIEIKTVHPFKSREWGEIETDQLPLHYVAQCQWGLGITGRRACRVFALIGDDLRSYVIERDDETIAAMRERAQEFWARYVIPQLRPPLDYADRKTLDTLRRLYPGTDGTAIDATAMHEHWRAVLQTAEDMLSKYEGVIDGARAHLMAEMGAAARLVFNDGKEYRRKLIKTKATTIHKPAGQRMDFRLVNTKEDA